MKKLFLGFIVVFSACGTPDFRSPTVAVYVDQFEQETCMSTEGVNFVISDVVPDDSNGSSIAYCLRGTKTIMFFA